VHEWIQTNLHCQLVTTATWWRQRWWGSKRE
jgi:hypothetical protein